MYYSHKSVPKRTDENVRLKKFFLNQPILTIAYWINTLVFYIDFGIYILILTVYLTWITLNSIHNISLPIYGANVATYVDDDEQLKQKVPNIISFEKSLVKSFIGMSV